MMNFLLILFFGSLLGITFMIGRKLIMLQNGQVQSEEETLFKPQYLEELKHQTIKNTKKYAYMGFVTTIRLYFRSFNLIKNRYRKVKNKINNRNKEGIIADEKKEISKFLKVISEYKHKIREIKRKIKEEEKNL